MATPTARHCSLPPTQWLTQLVSSKIRKLIFTHNWQLNSNGYDVPNYIYFQSSHLCLIFHISHTINAVLYVIVIILADGINKIVVVMPLVSLMEQQASRLASAGYQTIIVADFESGRRALSGENQYIFCSPETLSDVLLSLVIEDRHSAQLIKLVAVDESHCVVKWRVIIIIF